MTLAFDVATPPVASVTALARRHRLVFRFAILNLAALALLLAAYVRGWVDLVLAADESHLSIVILVVFAVGLFITGTKIWQVNTELNNLDLGRPHPSSWAAGYMTETAGRSEASRSVAGSSLRLRLASWISAIRHVANSLVLLGLIGTVIGFVIALSGVDPSKAGDPGSIAPMVAQLISGMSVALYTTLAGAVFNIWLMANYHMLNSGVIRLVTGIVAFGESHARA